MTSEQLQKLRGYYHAFLEHLDMLKDAPENIYTYLEESAATVILEELARLKSEFPAYVLDIDTRKLKTYRDGYTREGMRSLLGSVVGKLKVVIDTSDSSPIIQPREFPFIKDPGLRKIVERDFIELLKTSVSGCWKSVILLSGGIIEAILTDLLLQHADRAKASKSAPKDQKDIRAWGFVYLIKVSEELGLINPGVEKLSHSVRQYRDLVHPSVELRDKLTVAPEEAKIAMEVLLMLHRDLLK